MCRLLFLLVFPFFLFTQMAVAQSSECKIERCGEVKEFLDDICPVLQGKLVFVSKTPKPSSAACWCACGEDNNETMIVEMPFGTQVPIHTISRDEIIQVIDQDANWKDIQNIRWENGKVIKKVLVGNEAVGTRDSVYTLLENGKYLITPSDHVFMMSDKSLKRADRLIQSDQLMPASLQTQETSDLLSNNTKVKGVWRGRYNGELWNLEVENKEADTHGYFININGVVSADYTLQQAVSQSLKTGRPELGSSEYISEFSPKELLQPEVHWKGAGEFDIKFQPVEKVIVSSQLGLTFAPYEVLEPLPKDAVYFFPRSEAEPETPDDLYDRNQALPAELSAYLIRHYAQVYPDITFIPEWADGTVNAAAYRSNPKGDAASLLNPMGQEVRLFGGLLRHKKLGIEGLSLIISHEVGHFKVGKGKNKGWTSCEGEADYWAASVSQRKVWWGKQSLENINIGTEQFNTVYTPLWRLDNQKSVQVSCEMHPAPSCRKETFLAGLTGKPIPQCAKPLD